MENESEIKTRSIRADNDSFEKFKAIAEGFPNQAQAMAALISTYEVQKSKALIPDRQTEIETFAVHVQKINEIYNHSLILNHDAETRIRAEFQRQLESKDTVIQELQEKLSLSVKRQQLAEEARDGFAQELQAGKLLIRKLEDEINGLRQEKFKSDDIIDSLTEITTQYKGYAKENDKLKAAIADLQQQSNLLSLSLQQAEKSLEEAKEQYARETERQTQETERQTKFLNDRMQLEKEQEILKLERQYSDKINIINEDYQKRIEELLRRLENPNPKIEPASSTLKK